MKPFPWDEAMGFGFGVLRLAPDAFWRMTPREPAQAIHAVRGPSVPPLVRTDFDDLLARFPDAPRKGGM
ncbi:MAG: rcc01693 family protein [Nitrobacter sp.]